MYVYLIKVFIERSNDFVASGEAAPAFSAPSPFSRKISRLPRKRSRAATDFHLRQNAGYSRKRSRRRDCPKDLDRFVSHFAARAALTKLIYIGTVTELPVISEGRESLEYCPCRNFFSSYSRKIRTIFVREDLSATALR